ncbi:MAG: shikimate dehydrogenase [Candidatus Latescibacterota bacterium]
MFISGTTGVYGVIGDPVEHTLSPLMHNRALAEMGLDAVYVPFRVRPEDLEHAVWAIGALGIRGVNVTVPHKTEIIRYLDIITPEARAVGAVNTVINAGGFLNGDNTDIYGFTNCILKSGVTEQFPEKICILGAGGAARAAVYACAVRDEVREIAILNRTVHKAEKLADDIRDITGKKISAYSSDRESQMYILPHADMIVNTTTLGMYPHTGISPVIDGTGVFHSGQIVCDIIYNPARTKLLDDALQHGAKTIGGMAMLVFQGARSLTLWTGREAPVQVMIEALKTAQREMS